MKSEQNYPNDFQPFGRKDPKFRMNLRKSAAYTTYDNLHSLLFADRSLSCRTGIVGDCRDYSICQSPSTLVFVKLFDFLLTQDLLSRTNKLFDSLDFRTRQKEFEGKVDDAIGWLKKMTPKVQKLIDEPLKTKPKEAEDQLIRAKGLAQEIISNRGLITAVKTVSFTKKKTKFNTICMHENRKKTHEHYTNSIISYKNYRRVII